MKIEVIGAFEAKTKLSEILERVRRGQVFQITKRGRAVALLGPVESSRNRGRKGPSLTQRFAAIRKQSKSGPSVKELIHMGHKHS